MHTLLFALGFVSLTRVRIQQTGCLVQSLRLLGFIHNTYDSYQLPNYVWNTAKIVLIARGKFGKAALPLVNDLYCSLQLYNGWLPSWELTHIPLKVTTLSRWFSQLSQVATPPKVAATKVFGWWRVRGKMDASWAVTGKTLGVYSRGYFLTLTARP